MASFLLALGYRIIFVLFLASSRSVSSASRVFESQFLLSHSFAYILQCISFKNPKLLFLCLVLLSSPRHPHFCKTTPSGLLGVCWMASCPFCACIWPHLFPCVWFPCICCLLICACWLSPFCQGMFRLSICSSWNLVEWFCSWAGSEHKQHAAKNWHPCWKMWLVCKHFLQNDWPVSVWFAKNSRFEILWAPGPADTDLGLFIVFICL